jgi:hypothetical protein
MAKTPVHDALVTAIGMPPDELFNFVQEYDPADFFYDRKFNRIARSDHLVVVEITMRRGRSDAMKNVHVRSHCQEHRGAGRCVGARCFHLHARERLFGLVRRLRLRARPFTDGSSNKGHGASPLTFYCVVRDDRGLFKSRSSD